MDMKSHRQDAGYALLIVMLLVAALGCLLAGVIRYSDQEMRIATYQRNLESALYVAQAGAERGAAFVSNGGSAPTNFSGTVGDGTYVMAIIPASLPSSAPRTVGGWVDLGNTGCQFTLEKADGSKITNADFGTHFQGYTGPAAWVHFLGGGSGYQTTLMLDGAPYQVQNAITYDIFASVMSVNLYNDNVDAQTNAIGRWKISIASTCASFIVD
jgi:type II secretory pathway pseudopilin PulG